MSSRSQRATIPENSALWHSAEQDRFTPQSLRTRWTSRPSSCPVAPGVTSALGLLMADLRHDFAQTVLKPGSELSPTEITNWYEQLESQAMEQMSREGIAS